MWELLQKLMILRVNTILEEETMEFIFQDSEILGEVQIEKIFLEDMVTKEVAQGTLGLTELLN